MDFDHKRKKEDTNQVAELNLRHLTTLKDVENKTTEEKIQQLETAYEKMKHRLNVIQNIKNCETHYRGEVLICFARE
jgi:hypothetical protein